ncbi:hypothetical protein F2P81_005959 [Scophthalmus maximus]|uniref:Ig-like domain-containing protein n=1 Tax=Scophthalmus maximus TaxID=52904 RepID=A0A6A4T7Y7_SCOMX|nr:hypothetical protein F2P81_005959 [Scophthalmus maximus]
MLTSLHPLTYLSLRNIGSNVRLAGNRWQCDCSVRSLARRMTYDSSIGLQAWGMVCAFPTTLSGKDLLQLEEDDLNCFGTENSPELHRDVTVYSGSGILLSCSKQDSLWWTPSGQASVSEPQASLFISDVTERDTGLYVCMSEEHEVVSVFNLQISRIGRARRKTRSLPRTSRQVIPQDTPNRIGQGRNQRVTKSDLALAVCLSVLFTFLIAFILGVLARPFIDVHCIKTTNSKSSTATNSSAEERQYENEAYSNGEEPEERVTHRERRVKFGAVNFREDINVEYLNTVASSNQESITNDAVIECEVSRTEEDEHTAGDSRSENSSRPEDNQRHGRDLSGIDARCTHTVEVEHISDPAEREDRRSLSSCSDSSLSDREFKKDQMTQGDLTTPKYLQLAEESVHQRPVFSTSKSPEVPPISLVGSAENPGFSSETSADWAPHTNNPIPTEFDLSQGDEEQFEFSDSARSTSARSSIAFSSFNDSKQIELPPSDRDDVSSCGSYLSEDEPTQYNVNQDEEEEEDTEKNHNKSEVTNTCLKHDDTQRTAERPEQTFSSQSTDSDSEQMQYTIKQKTKKGKGQEKSINEYNKLSSRSVTAERDTREKIKPMPRTKCRGVSLGRVSQIKNNLDIIAPFPASGSSSSDEIKDETTKHTKKQEHGDIYMSVLISEEYQSLGYEERHITPIKRHLDIKAPSMPNDSSSSDESADRIMDHMQRQKQGEMHMTRLQFQESQTASHDSDTRWPALDLEHIPHSKSRLDIRSTSMDSNSSSSSDSKNETTHHADRPGTADISKFPLQKSETSHDPDAKWPALDLQHPHIKRRLDIKAPSPPTDSSPSRDSEDETTHHIDRPGNVDIEKFPLQKSQTTHHDPDAKWPALNLEHIPHIKRHLDIKAPLSPPDSSSSSDSEDETTHHTDRPGMVDIAKFPLQKSQTTHHDPDAKWPVLNLEHIPHIKRRLDIKAPSPPPDSSSSSDSQDKTTGHKEKHISGLLLKESQTASHDSGTRWPALDLEHIPHIKRRLDIKAPSPPPDSSPSSDSEDETTHHTDRPGTVDIEKFPLQKSQTTHHDPDAKWPVLNLEHIPHIKRRLDIKAPSPPPDSSSSSDSEDETTHHTDRPGMVDIAKLPLQKSQTTHHDPDAKWPALNLEHIPHIKRCLDIKAPSPPPDSASCSDSEDETTHHTDRPGMVDIAKFPLQKSQTTHHDPDAKWPVLNLEHIPHIKRRLDIKAPSPPPDSSSSSDSEDETTHHTDRPGMVDIAKFPLQKSQTTHHDPDAKWPVLNLEHIPHIKRRLDIKAPSPPPDSSSSSDSEDETTHHTDRPGMVDIAKFPLQKSQTTHHDPDAKWPVLNLEHIPHIKRRLDIKAPSPPPDSSSSSDSEDETTHHTDRPGMVDIAKFPLQKSQTTHHDPDAKWPVLNLEHIPHIKRRLDIKAPSPPPDSSSSSDSEDETTHHTDRPGMVDIAKFPLQKSQTTHHDPDAKWPVLNLEHIPHIKRRLDIKAPSPPPDSSSSSDSEDETTHHTDRPGMVDIAKFPLQKSQTTHHDPDAKWPVLNLEHIPHIKRRLDIKAPSPPPDSSSSSDSEDETTHHTDRPGMVDIAKFPLQKSQTTHHDPDAKWPVLNLEHIPHIKRRLDIKAPSPPPDSSSSSDSEDETTHHTDRPGMVDIAKFPLQKSQTTHHDPDAKWPVLNLEHIPHIKRRLDIKAPSPPPDSSSSSDSEDETTHHTDRPGMVDIAKFPLQKSQTTHHDPDAKWPVLNLEHIPHIKRRLDIKAPSPPPDSSSSSDSEDETTHHTDRPGMVDIAKFPLQKSQTTHHDPDAKWPVLNLEHIPHIKRRLDIKAPSPPPDSSSSSDSEDETTHHTDRPGMVDIAKFPLQKSQTTHHDPDAKWPVLNLEHIPHIKRRLDIKAPSPPPDSSSSSDSQDKTTGHKEKHISGLLLKESQTASHDSGTRWPALDLEHIPHIKRRLDIKAPSPPPDSSPSSDSEDETTHHTDRTVDIEKFPLQKSQTERHDPDAEWPVLNLEHIPHIKGRLDIKAPSPPPDSSSSSDREDETTHQAIRPGTVSNAKLPLQKSQTNLHDPDAKWPALDLENIPAIKRCLDIKAPSLNLDSFSSSESKDKATDHTKKQRPGVVKLNSCYSGNSSDEQDDISNSSINPDPRWPELGLSSVPMVKRRLDIKTYSPSTESSSSSNKSDSWTTDLSVKGGVGVTTHEQWTMMHKLNLGIPNISRRLDIKAPSAQPDLVLDSISEDYQQSGSNSSKRESEGENRDLNVEVGMGVSAISKAVEKELIRSPKTPVINISPYPKTDHNIKLEKYTVISDDRGGKQTNYNISTTPEINPELQSRWATMNLGISRFRKHLEITSNTHVPPNLLTSPSPDSPSSWSGESWTGNKCSRTRLTRRGDGMQEIHTDSSLTLENKPVNLPPTLKSRDQEDYSPPKITGFGTPYVRKYLDIRVSEKAPASPPLHQLPESSSSSESEGVSTESAGNRWRETSQQSVVQDGAAPQNDTSWFVARAVDVRLDESDSETEEVERKAGVELNSTTSEEEQRSDSMRPHRTLTNIPYVKRALDIRAPLQREFSSKSNREDETTDYRVPNLNFGVPRIKRRLDIKAPSPEPNYSSTSCSESGNEVIGYTGYQSREASNMSGMTDYDFQITYKRSILKGPLTLGNSLSPSPTTDRAEMFTAAQGLSHSVGDRNASPSPWTVPSDDIVKKRIEPQHTIDEEVPPEIRWTGIGRHLSDFPMSGPRRLETVVQASPAEAEPSPAVSSRMKSDDKLKQDRGRADVALMHAYSYPIASRVSPASSRAFDKFDNTSGSTNEIFRSLSADRFGKKGLGALKTMSSKTLQWDTEDKDIDAV